MSSQDAGSAESEAKSNANDPSDKELMSRYEHRVKDFPARIPTNTNNIFDKNLVKYTVSDMKSTYPFCHGAALLLALKMFEFKREFGTPIEKDVYCASNPSNFTIVDFMHRIATKRAIHFLNPGDSWQLRHGPSGYGGWERVGSEVDRGKGLTLREYMSYDELMISAMCGITSKTRFINRGARNNCGRRGIENSWVPSGIYMGLIGARFEKPGFMEHSLMCTDLNSSQHAPGQGIVRDGGKSKSSRSKQNASKASKIPGTGGHGSHASNAANASNVTKKKNALETPDIDDIYASTDDDAMDSQQPDASDDAASDAKNGMNNVDADATGPQESDTEMKEMTVNDASTNHSGAAQNSQMTLESDAKVEESAPLTQEQIDARRIDLFCEWYGNVGSIPTYNELNILHDAVKNGEDESGELAKYLKQRFIAQDVYWSGATYFDRFLFKIRMRMSLELFLFDSDYRTQREGANELAYCHLVGLGLGVWTLSGFKTHETQAFVECVKDIIETTSLPHVGAVDFSWFDKIAPFADNYGDEPVFEQDDQGTYFCNDASGHRIDVVFSKRCPADILTDSYANYKVCAMYAWDGNALPGNEYYLGSLAASGDPAAACCSTIPYVQNSMINVEYITGENTMIYFRDLEDQTKYKRMRLSEVNALPREEWIKMAEASRPYYNELPQIDLEPFLYG